MGAIRLQVLSVLSLIASAANGAPDMRPVFDTPSMNFAGLPSLSIGSMPVQNEFGAHPQSFETSHLNENQHEEHSKSIEQQFCEQRFGSHEIGINNPDLSSDLHHVGLQSSKEDHQPSSHVESSSSSFSQSSESSNGEHSESSAASESVLSSVSDGKTTQTQTAAISEAEEIKTADGHTDCTEASTDAQTAQVTTSEGGKEYTETSTVCEGQVNSAKDGCTTQHVEAEAAAQALTTTTSEGGAKLSHTISAGQSEVAQTSDGKTQITEAASLADAYQTKDAGGFIEQSAEAVAVAATKNIDEKYASGEDEINMSAETEEADADTQEANAKPTMCAKRCTEAASNESEDFDE